MIRATAAARSDVPVDLLAGYLDYVAGLDCAQQAKSLRKRGAIRFLDRFDDLDRWMTRPTRARLDDTKRADAWPFVSWCFATGRLHADVDLIAARHNGCHYSTWARLHPNDVERAVTAGSDLGWGDNWSEQVGVLALAFICLASNCTLDDLSADTFDTAAAELEASISVTSNHRKIMGGRLRSLRQVCFQLGLVATPPEHPNVRHRSLVDQLAKVPQSDIARVMARYLEICSTALRSSTIEDRCDKLRSVRHVAPRPSSRNRSPRAARSAGDGAVPDLEPHPIISRPSSQRAADLTGPPTRRRLGNEDTRALGMG